VAQSIARKRAPRTKNDVTASRNDLGD